MNFAMQKLFKYTAELRQYAPRLSAYMPARIVVPGKISPAHCIIREISPAGGRIEIDVDWILPKQFWLRIIGDTIMYKCTIEWRAGRNVGVNFDLEDRTSWWMHSQRLSNRLPNRARLA
jgi:hypothetical protein